MAPETLGLVQSDLLSISISFAGLAIAFFVVQAIRDLYFSPLSKFPGPKLWALSKLPYINAVISGDEARACTELHKEYGPVVRTGPRQLSFAGGASSWKAIYGFPKPGRTAPYKDNLFYFKSVNGTHNIITAPDQNHGRQRKILAHAFSDKALKEQEPLLKRWAQLLKRKLAERADGKDEIDMVKYYNFTTFDIMGDLTFAKGLDMLEGSEYSPWVKTIFGSIKNGAFWRCLRAHDPISRYIVEQWLFKSKKARAGLHKHWSYIAERVHRRLEYEPVHEDLWSKILAKDEQGDGFNLGEHESNASLFMIAGTETTATLLSGATYYLLKNPSALKKLTAEIRGAFTDFDDATLESMARLKYMHAVLMETFRLYPPVPIGLPRVTPTEGMEVDGKFVPAGTTVAVGQFATYRFPDHFKNPDEFHPERWLGDEEYKNDHLDALEPFSVGPRNCLGKNLAWHEMRVLLVLVLLHFDLKLSKDSENWAEQQKVWTLWEKTPLLCSMVPRSDK